MSETRSPAGRWLALAGVGALAVLGWMLYGDMISLEGLIARRDELAGLVTRHPSASVVVYMLAYGLVVVLALPAASLMTLAGGWLFGPLTGSLATVLAATAGAIVLFWLARSLLHDFFLARTGEALGKLRRGFQSDAASYLLTLRLAPVFPFFVVNIAAALLGARPATYAWTTLVGILPGTVAYSLAGAGLGGVLDREAQRLALCRSQGGTCTANLDVSALVSGEIGLALGALAGVALLSVIVRKRLNRPAQDAPVPSPLAVTRKDTHD